MDVQSQTASVLVVDDNPLIVQILRTLLASEGYEVHTASNGEEALQSLDKCAVDLIICDVMMPKMDGFELHQEVRARASLAHVPFVFLSALSEDHEVHRAKECGADDYLVKPFEPRELLAVVKGKLTRSKVLRSLGDERYEAYRKKVVHTLSHEFRTPLVAINTGTELLLEQQDRLEPGRVQTLLEAIRRGGLRLERLVNDFMVLQQIEAGVARRLAESRSTPLSVKRMIESLIEARHEWVTQEKVSVRYVESTQDAEVFGYEPQLQDAVWRLVENAVKFRGDSDLVEIAQSADADEVAIEVRDRGLGIDVSKVREALKLFGQINRDRWEQQGSGLGLAIVTRYAEIHLGRLEFKPRDGGGTVVALVLPRLVRS